MPPHVPRKRLRDTSPGNKSNAPSRSRAQRSAPRKPTLYDDLDAASTPHSSTHLNSALQDLAGSDDESSLTSLSDGDFEDVPPLKKQKAEESADEDDDVEFEDVAAPGLPTTDTNGPVPSGDLELTLVKDTRISLTNPFGEKKGPSKRERRVRIATHSLHVLTLLWHNAVRNSWLCDMEVQATMLSHLSPRLWDEVDRFRRSSGLVKEPPPKSKSRGKSKGKGKATVATGGKEEDAETRSSRDWSSAADMLEAGAVDMSHGDPLFRLMQSLSSWWKQRFRIATPGLRKWGYMSLERLDRLTKAYDKDPNQPMYFGEKLANLDDFRRSARLCRGSRDVGSQLFTALLRGLGLEARMVANLQTLGFGWNKLEDADEEDEVTLAFLDAAQKTSKPTDEQLQPSQTSSSSANTTLRQRERSSTKSSGKLAGPHPVEDSNQLELEYKDSDDDSVVELETYPKRAGATLTKPFDADLEFPHYWTEVLSPVTKKFLPIDPIVKSIIATNRELTEAFEPRGAKADKARQITAYIVGFSQDGTAKDVTVRYLKRQMLPGRTKGMRMPPEKVPVYNRHGKVKRYEQFDWFKTAMSGYKRGSKKAPITDLDELEDSTDLKPAQPEKKEVKEGEETLQYYKQSKEFVLQRHLKREEALKPDAVAVKLFKNKGKGGKAEEENVYLRSDVLQVKSAETWHKQGRAPAAGEHPLKRVPYRAATINRRREIMEAEAATGEKVMQGLFSLEQTDWIIPPPISNGIIPKNEYGNIDLFVDHMCPQGAVHVPYRGTVRVCKRLQIDYAEAVVDFEFGHRMAVPVIQGVVIAEEHYDNVVEELQKDEVERARKEDEKRRKVALGTWRKFLMGMRIVERIRREYGEIDESVSVFSHSKGSKPMAREAPPQDGQDMAGGFLPEGYEEEDEEEVNDGSAPRTSSFFATAAEEGAADDDGLVVEEHDAAMPLRNAPKSSRGKGR